MPQPQDPATSHTALPPADRYTQLANFVNLVARMPGVNVRPVIVEMAKLLQLDPKAVFPEGDAKP